MLKWRDKPFSELLGCATLLFTSSYLLKIQFMTLIKISKDLLESSLSITGLKEVSS